MLSEQKRDNVLRPFQHLFNQFQAELVAAREVHVDWQKAKFLSNMDSELADNDEFADEVHQIEKSSGFR